MYENEFEYFVYVVKNDSEERHALQTRASRGGLGEYWTKYLGGKFVLEYTSKLDDALLKKLEFEPPKTWINDLGEEVDRFYDFTLEGVQYELKAWKGWAKWADGVIQKQFMKDYLANPKLTSLDKLQWVFKKTDGITEDVLKDKVIGALKTGIPKHKEVIDENTVKKLFPKDLSITRNNFAEKLIENLDKIENFKSVFKVVE